MIMPVECLKNGFQFETVFKSNPRPDSSFGFVASLVNGTPVGKVILCRNAVLEPGRKYLVRVQSITKPRAKGHGAIIVEALHDRPALNDATMWVHPAVEAKILALLEEGHNILMDGPQGSGKTVLSRTIARALGMEYVFFNCSSVFESTEFLATLHLSVNPDGKHETTWIKTDILRALEDAGSNPGKEYLIFLDELNRMRDMARNGIMPALDATRRLFNPLTGTTIAIPDNVRWVAAINNGPQFSGASVVDPAQLDRFSPIKIGYPPHDQEVELLCGLRPQVARAEVARIVTAANAVRCDENLGLDLSVRATEEAVMLLGNPRIKGLGPDPLPEVLKTSFCGRFAGTWDDKGTDAGLVWQVIQPKLGKKSFEGPAHG